MFNMKQLNWNGLNGIIRKYISRGSGMLKRKFGNRTEWKRVLKRKYSQTYLDTEEFKGYITLLNTIKVTEPLSVRYGEKNVCIVDNGYMWLQQFPLEKNHSVTTMFDANGDIVQWYIDICLCNGIENDIPWMDDLFLDIVLLPTGEIIEKDADEIEAALSKGIIDKSLYDLAWNEMNNIKNQISTDSFDLIRLSNNHKEILSKILK
jgi:predicted RNA-binding protein associated with RNAse of E/G family